GNCGGAGCGRLRDGGDRNGGAGGRRNVNVLERIGILLETRINFENNVILIELGKHRGDLTLAERVVKDIINGGWKDSEARCGIAINDEHGLQAEILLIAGDVTQLRKKLKFGDETR